MANFILKFPIRGINKSRLPDEQPEATSPGLNNMRAFDIADDRVRGGQRPGMAKRYTQKIINPALGTGPVVAMCEVSVSEL